MIEEDIAYIAGFLDGEGCFTLGQYWKPCIACENTYRPVIYWLKKQLGGNITPVKGKKKNHRKTYRWAVVCEDAAKVCKVIAPYLHEKAEQAMILIAVHQTMKMPKIGNRLLPEVIKQRNWFKKRLKKLKGRIK